MNRPATSVIVVSRGRPKSLRRCLLGISQLYFEELEVIVVTDRPGLNEIQTLKFFDQIKAIAFDQANISAARNLGLSHAAGSVVAFIDDDAVPEPGWLYHLTEPFNDPSVVAAGGFVRGRNGISYQWKANAVSYLNYDIEIPFHDVKPMVFPPDSSRVIKTQGTNCAFRASALREIGGFDTAFRYFLDEVDVNMRLAEKGATAIVPLAEVHHGYAHSERRWANRFPTSLYELGASTVLFLKKYAPAMEQDSRLRALVSEQRQALLSHLEIGNCEPRDVEHVIGTLEKGIADGMDRSPTPGKPIVDEGKPLRPFKTDTTPQMKVISGRWTRSRRLRSDAAVAASNGEIVSLFLLSFTTQFHKVRYTDDGYWTQRGGVFGKSLRSDRLIRAITLGKRVKMETERVAKARYPWISDISTDDVGRKTGY